MGQNKNIPPIFLSYYDNLKIIFPKAWEYLRNLYISHFFLPTPKTLISSDIQGEEDKKLEEKQIKNHKFNKFRLLADLFPNICVHKPNIWSDFFKVELILNTDSPAISWPNLTLWNRYSTKKKKKKKLAHP